MFFFAAYRNSCAGGSGLEISSENIAARRHGRCLVQGRLAPNGGCRSSSWPARRGPSAPGSPRSGAVLLQHSRVRAVWRPSWKRTCWQTAALPDRSPARRTLCSHPDVSGSIFLLAAVPREDSTARRREAQLLGARMKAHAAPRPGLGLIQTRVAPAGGRLRAPNLDPSGGHSPRASCRQALDLAGAQPAEES